MQTVFDQLTARHDGLAVMKKSTNASQDFWGIFKSVDMIFTSFKWMADDPWTEADHSAGR